MRIGQVLFLGPVVYDVDVACVVLFSNEEAVDKKAKAFYYMNEPIYHNLYWEN